MKKLVIGSAILWIVLCTCGCKPGATKPEVGENTPINQPKSAGIKTTTKAGQVATTE